MTASKVADNAVADDVITLDRRTNKDRRSGDGDVEALDTGVVKTPRRKKQRRRHIDPTTCERDYNAEEIEFMRAMDDYKRDSGRMFPTCSEVLEVIRALGYVKLTEQQAAEMQAAEFGDAVDSEDESLETEDLDAEEVAEV